MKKKMKGNALSSSCKTKLASPTDYNRLIPEMEAWNNGKGIDVESWIRCSGNYQFAIGYSRIFWPRFVEFEKYILRDGFSLDSLRGFERQPNAKRENVEVVMNHLHIGDIHYHDLRNLTRKQAVYLGVVLREIYQVKLAWQFPSRRFEIFFDESRQEDIIAYEITFSQIPGPV